MSNPASPAPAPAPSKGKSRSWLRILSRFPWTLLVIIYLIVTTVARVSMNGPAGYAFLIVGLLVLFIEFFKSSDITTSAFLLDLVVAVLGVATAAVLLTLMFLDPSYEPTFFHGYGAAVILVDAILGPFNAFRGAKRNVEFDNLPGH